MNNEICYRTAQKNETEEVKKIYQYCFQDTPAFIELYFERCYQTENTIVATKNGHVLASAQLNPYEILLRKQRIAVGYVVAVDTLPEARGMKLAQNVLYHTLKKAEERNNNLILLMPFETQFYRRYGWEHCYFKEKFVWPCDKFQRLGKDSGRLERVDLFEKRALLQSIYEKLYNIYHGIAIRNAEKYEILCRDWNIDGAYAIVCYDNDDQPIGYMIYKVENQKFTILEMICGNAYAEENFFQYIYRHASQVNQVLGAVMPYSMLRYQVPRDCTLETAPFMMARIQDVARLFEQLKVNLDGKIMVKDDFWPKNNGVFQQEKGLWQKNSENDEFDLQFDIGALTQLVMGAVDMEELYRQNRVKVRNANVFAAWQTYWHKTQNYINEYY